MYGEPLQGGTRSDKDFFAAIASEVVDQIPISEHRTLPCLPEEGGVDVYEGFAKRNLGDSPISRLLLSSGMVQDAYAVNGFRKGKKFLFSISDEAAKRYLPNHYWLYSGEDRFAPRIEIAIGGPLPDDSSDEPVN